MKASLEMVTDVLVSKVLLPCVVVMLATIVADLPVLVVRKRSESEIHISFRDLRRGDIRLLNNTVVKFQLFTPDNQLVRSDQRPFQLKINESTRLEVARVVFRELQPGVKYNLSYSFPIGSIVHTKTAMVTTQSSGKISYILLCYNG